MKLNKGNGDFGARTRKRKKIVSEDADQGLSKSSACSRVSASDLLKPSKEQYVPDPFDESIVDSFVELHMSS